MFTFICLSAYTFADNLSNLTQTEMLHSQILNKQVLKVREFVHPSEVFFTENGIYISQDDGHFMQVESLFATSNGLCIIAGFPSGLRAWECPKCRFVNEKTAKFCARCNWPDDD